MPNFERYSRAYSRGGRVATVTIQRRGNISFSPSAIRALGSPARIVFLHDKTERLIGFRAARQDDELSYPVRGQGSGHLVSAMAFCHYLGLDLSESRRYPLIEEDGTYCIDLKQPGVTVTSNRATRR